jgi:hypothetical protein
MPKLTRNFIAGKMNKDVDERLVPNGEYIDAMNIRLNSTENSEKGVIENAIGNTKITDLRYNNTPLSSQARAIGAATDGARENIYWFVHDPAFVGVTTGKVDMIVSYNTVNNSLTYHIVSTNDGGGVNTRLNFSFDYLITGVNIIDQLLFFTDDLNPPRVINIDRPYGLPNNLNLDTFTAEEIAVIKPPPSVPLVVTPLTVNTQDNFMEERFLCFGYRYRYRDGEYGATTPFTNPIFIPDTFGFNATSFLNEGMKNIFNACQIEYNVGSEEVIGIDILFKEAGSNVIRVIEKVENNGVFAPNSTQTLLFSNQKIFTILPESELLRLYDNVPRLAKAQTIMGNRIIYGNYLEGYDLITDENQPLFLEYTVGLLTEELGVEDITPILSTGTYAYGGGNTGSANNLIGINLFPFRNDLKAGAILTISFTYRHAFFNASASSPTDTTDDIPVTFTYLLQRDYDSTFEFASSPEFQSAVGTVTNIQPIATACDGTTYTDIVNCLIPQTLNNFVKTESGVNLPNDPIQILANPTAQLFALQLIAMKFVDSVTLDEAFEFYEIVNASATFQKIGDTSSLHSNRGYEVGIVYMDENKRSSTVLTSTTNNLYIPCEFSITKNRIQIEIPPTQKPPAWASTYKFAIKADRAEYEVIYSTIYLRDGSSNFAYFLLEGENMRKVEVGDRLIVKSDSTGAMQNCVTVTVLEKEAKEENFLGNSNPAPAGVYMKLSISQITAELDPNAVIDPGTEKRVSGGTTSFPWNGNFPIVRYPCNIPDPANVGQFIDYDIPAGSRIVFDFEFRREGRKDGAGACERRTYTLRKTLISTQDYTSFENWFVGDNIDRVIGDGTAFVGGGGGGQIFNTFVTPTTNVLGNIPASLTVNYWRFFRDSVTNELLLMVTGTAKCSGTTYPRDKTQSTITARIQVFRAENVVIFETEPQDTLPDVYFEGEQIFGIDSQRQHLGNVQDQDYSVGLPAIINTNFMNCYTFGNGAESYKIRDSIIGRQFNLGNRILAVAAQDFKAARRFADLTYSGVYNNETNVNKFNEFNLGLLNFKQLERYFGPIYLLDGRETDIRVMQEDKISYVLAGKNLLSDAEAGGAIVSIPEVLGTQIARIEEYGISFNPESFAKWGDSCYFTDAKRGAVLQLKGAGRGESLIPISEAGMGTFFRDLFIGQFGTQKLGGYDPYMKEYVLTSNNRLLLNEAECLPCGQATTYNVSAGEDVLFCVNLRNLVGLTRVTYNIVSADGDIEVETIYDGNTFTSGEVNTSGIYEFPKDKVSVQQAGIRVRSVTGNAVIQVLVACPTPDIINIVEITVSNNINAGELIHNEYRYISGVFVSPLQSTGISLVSGTDNPLVSQYQITTGAQGLGAIPVNGSTVRMISNKRGIDNYIFNPLANNFRYLRSATLYNNTEADMQTLLGLANVATPITGGGNIFQAEFIMPGGGAYLYMIWDYRESYSKDICFDVVSSRSLCCCACEP